MKKEMYLLGLAIFLAGLPFGSSLAQVPIHAELGYQHSHGEGNGSAHPKSDLLYATYFLTGFQIDSQPYAEAHFLNRVPSITLYSVTANSGDAFDLDNKGNSLKIVLTDSSTPVSANLAYSRYSDEIHGAQLDETTITAIGLGYYLAQNWQTSFTYTHMQTKYDSFYTETSDIYTLATKYVHIDAQSQAWNLEAAISQHHYPDSPFFIHNTSTDYNVSGDYYFNNRFSLGLGVGITQYEGGHREDELYSANVTGYINEYVGLFVDTVHYLQEYEQSATVNTFGLNIRF